MLVIAHKKYYTSNDIVYQNPLGQIQFFPRQSPHVVTHLSQFLQHEHKLVPQGFLEEELSTACQLNLLTIKNWDRGHCSKVLSIR